MGGVVVYGDFQASDAPSERLQETLQLLPLGDKASPSVIEENMRRLRDYVDRRGRSANGKKAIAEAFGGQLIEDVIVLASAAPDASGDTKLAHRIGRTPGCIAWWEVHVPETGAAPPPNALLYGHPRGTWGAGGGNQQAWDDRFVYLRASADAHFNLVLV